MIVPGSFSKIWLFIVLLFFSFKLLGQNTVNDSTVIAEANIEENEEVHSPRKATIYSAILPGLGQAYNKKYWKIPIIYAGFGTIGYFIHWNNDNYNILKQAYSDLTDSDESTNSYENLEASDYYDLNNPTDFNNFKTGISKQQSYFRRNRDLLIISMVGFYGLNIIDASVDAHLFDFDISEDLTFNWEPTIQYKQYQYVYGVSCIFTF